MSVPADPAAALAAIKEIAWKIELTQHFQSAGLVILLYDYLLTLSDEIRHIWPSKWSLIKIVFLANRYIPPLAIVNVLMTVTAFTFDVAVSARDIYNITSKYLHIRQLELFMFLVVRVHALWGLRRWIGIALGIAFACSTSAAVIITTIHDVKIAKTLIVLKDMRVCTPGLHLPQTYFVVWLPSLIFEAVVFLMTMYKVVGPERKPAHSITRLIYRDGVLYFVTIFAARVANMVLFIGRDSGIVYSVLFLLMGLGSAMVSRMILNLRSWRTDEKEGHPVAPRSTHFPRAISERISIPTGTGIEQSARENRVYFTSQHADDAFDAENDLDFIMQDSKDDFPLKIIQHTV